MGCALKIADRSFVAIDYRLALESGEEIDRSPEGAPLAFVTGMGQIIPGLEDALRGRVPGEDFQVTIEPEAGYGLVQPELLQVIPRERFPAGTEIKPGMAFQTRGPRGPVKLTVAAVSDDTVTVDLNHPMAGKRLFFDVKIVEVREPRPEELPSVSGGCACGPREQNACGCGPAESGGCGSGSGCCG